MEIKINKTLTWIIAILLLAAVLALNSFYTIEEQENAVVTTLGLPHLVDKAGPHFKIPFIQQVRIVETVIYGVSIGYEGNLDVVESESLMITSDYNFVNVDFYLQYQISDPIKFLYASNDPRAILKDLAQSCIRDTVGIYTVDAVITDGKSEIQASIKEKLTARLIQEDFGLNVVNIIIQDAEPPTIEVMEAFKAVETAKQNKETQINTANKYKSEQEPAARAEIDSIMKTAESTKQARINDAKEQVAMFNAMYSEYQRSPSITKQRMFFEAMEDLLPKMKVIIDGGSESTSKILPLDDFFNNASTAQNIPAAQGTATQQTEQGGDGR